MEWWKAAILGAVQGLTEFLPVSSSGHLLLFERLLGAEGGGLFLGVMLHAGTLLAVLAVYARRLAHMALRARKQLWYLLLATIPAALVGVLLGDLVDRVFYGGEWLWAAFLLTALILLLADLRMRAGGPARPLNARRALAVGAAQALAVLPGLSRSGVTLAAGVFCGLSREDAADFSFLLSLPVIGGAFLLELLSALTARGAVVAISWQSLAVGTLCAAACGLLSVRLMLRCMKGARLWPFALYLAALSAALLPLRLLF